jgi:glycine amidinotransferase
MVNQDAVNTIRALERAGFTPVPARLRHSRLYAGAFHCSTLDIRRDERLESYF